MLRAERMKSLPRIVKEPDSDQDIRPYDFFAGFKIVEEPQEEEPEEEEEEEEPEEEETISPEELERMVEEAEEKAKMIISDARKQAEILREKGYREGREDGVRDGAHEAYEEQRRILDEEVQELQENITDVIQSVSREKEKLLEQ